MPLIGAFSKAGRDVNRVTPAVTRDLGILHSSNLVALYDKKRSTETLFKTVSPRDSPESNLEINIPWSYLIFFFLHQGAYIREKIARSFFISLDLLFKCTTLRHIYH